MVPQTNVLVDTTQLSARTIHARNSAVPNTTSVLGAYLIPVGIVVPSGTANMDKTIIVKKSHKIAMVYNNWYFYGWV